MASLAGCASAWLPAWHRSTSCDKTFCVPFCACCFFLSAGQRVSVLLAPSLQVLIGVDKMTFEPFVLQANSPNSWPLLTGGVFWSLY